jgi:probable addiction module antidote protein
MFEVRRYLDAAGADVFGEWLAAQRDHRAVAKILVRIDRLAVGNFGDCKPLSAGVWELRIDWGTWLPPVLRVVGAPVRVAVMWWRQTTPSCRRETRDRKLGRLPTQGRTAMKRKASVSHDKAVERELRMNPRLAVAYLNAALDDSTEPEVLLIALRRVAESMGGMAKVARAAGIERESLYRALSAKGNPRLSTLVAVTKALGLKLSVETAAR